MPRQCAYVIFIPLPQILHCMTQFYFNAVLEALRRGITKISTALFLTVLLSFSFISFSNAQPVHLSFQNPTRIFGTAGADGAVYRFSNVTTGIDALVTIIRRSSSRVVLSSMDITSTGSAAAFQPQIDRTGNNANRSWYMDFSVHFVAAGTTNELPTGSTITYKTTAYDIDGNGDHIREYVQAYLASSYQLNDPASQLTVTSVNATFNSVNYSGTEFYGPTTNYTDISTGSPKVSATLSYGNQKLIYFRLGARNNSNSSDAASNRYYSLDFTNFLYIAPASTLPLTLLSFNAKLANNVSVLDWVTANEVNFSHFTIQRSTDGASFTDIATVNGKQAGGSANTSYTYTDNSVVQSSIVYYRLKMVDQDETFNYSPIVLVNRSQVQNQAAVIVYPNPVVSELRVTIPNSWQGKTVSYTIYGGNGNVITQKVVASAGQTETFNFSGIAAGLYTIRVTKDAETIVKQFVKQ